MKNFSKRLNIIAGDTNKYLKKFFLVQKKHSFLEKPVRYSLFSGGKRIRAAIIVNVGKIFGISYKKLIVIGSAVECMHSYSLIHDDLPAMDDDDFRRGKLTTHKKFNEFTAILAGNSLLTLSFQILSSDKLKLSDKTRNKLIQELSYCTGYTGLGEGQYLDLTYENKKVTKEKIIIMQKKKTGKLFGFCFECIAIIKGFNLKERKIFREIGTNVGLLFQIADDLIDHRGNEKIAGKPTKRDKKKGKATLINLIGYKKTLIFARKLEKNIKNDLKKYGSKAANLIQSIEFILRREF